MKDRLIHPSAFDPVYLIRSTQKKIKPERHTQVPTPALRFGLKMYSHPIAYSPASEAYIEDVASVCRKRIASRLDWDSFVMGPRKLSPMVWQRN